MSALVNEKFREWTAGLDLKDGMISIFEHIRDIPYSLAVPQTDLIAAPEQILSLGRGYCGPKHYLLAEMFQKLGVEVVYAIFPFFWNDPDLRYPQELRQLATGLPVLYHLACRVRINDRWVLVDATWDRPLARGGFPVNEHWDGRADTLCAVKPLRSAVRTAFCHTAINEPYGQGHERDLNPLEGEEDLGDAREYTRHYREKTGMGTADEIKRIRRFYQEFDAWLQVIREHR
jgi:hypothetical protein